MPLPRTLAVGSRRRWQRLSRDLFDRGGLDELFGYARNLLTGTVIVAAGLHAAHHEGRTSLPGLVWTLHFAGCVVSVIGVAILALNLFQGLRSLAQRHRHVAVRVLACLVYVGVSMRLTQVIVLFRYGM